MLGRFINDLSGNNNAILHRDISIKRSGLAMRYMSRIIQKQSQLLPDDPRQVYLKNMVLVLSGKIKSTIKLLEGLEKYAKENFRETVAVNELSSYDAEDVSPVDISPRSPQTVLSTETLFQLDQTEPVPMDISEDENSLIPNDHLPPESAHDSDIIQENDSIANIQQIHLSIQNLREQIEIYSGRDEKDFKIFDELLMEHLIKLNEFRGSAKIDHARNEVIKYTENIISLLRAKNQLEAHDSDHHDEIQSCDMAMPKMRRTNNSNILRARSLSQLHANEEASISQYKLKNNRLPPASTYAKPKEQSERAILTVPYKMSALKAILQKPYDPKKAAKTLKGVAEKIYRNNYLKLDIETQKEIEIEKLKAVQEELEKKSQVQEVVFKPRESDSSAKKAHRRASVKAKTDKELSSSGNPQHKPTQKSKVHNVKHPFVVGCETETNYKPTACSQSRKTTLELLDFNNDNSCVPLNHFPERPRESSANKIVRHITRSKSLYMLRCEVTAASSAKRPPRKSSSCLEVLNSQTSNTEIVPMLPVGKMPEPPEIDGSFDPCNLLEEIPPERAPKLRKPRQPRYRDLVNLRRKTTDVSSSITFEATKIKTESLDGYDNLDNNIFKVKSKEVR